MKKLIGSTLSMFILLALVVTPASATKPGEDVNPNGFPSGEHYNLNIIGKKDGFTCPEQEYDEFGDPIYGNVVFVPQNGEGIEILMEPGKGKKAAAIPTLQVIDSCSAFDGDAAVLQLPKNDAGYDVYARALATPTNNPDMSITPDLIAVEDEFGNDLMYLGLVTSNGFETPYVSFTRKKGKSVAVDITGLFEWTGDVCYFTEGYCDPTLGCDATMELCCTDADMDGIYESCVPKEVDVECPEGTEQVTAFCNSYTEPTWVFNIGDFVTYLWDVENNGLKLLQVRFYPR
jgi:hypothetical protein